MLGYVPVQDLSESSPPQRTKAPPPNGPQAPVRVLRAVWVTNIPVNQAVLLLCFMEEVRLSEVG